MNNVEEIDASGLDISGARVSFIDEAKALRSELVESVNGSIEELDANSLREAERTRDALQTDFLSFKTATGTRIEGLETQTAKLSNSIEGLAAQATKLETKIEGTETELAEKIAAANSKLTIPLYAAIGLGAANLICLILLLLR